MQKHDESVKRGFERRRVAFVVIMYIFTGGLYGIYLIANHGFAASQIDPHRGLRMLSRMLTVTVIVFCLTATVGLALVSSYEDPEPAAKTAKLLFLGAFGAAISTYVLAAMISSRVARVIRDSRSTACSPSAASFLAFVGFSGSIYLQYKINRAEPAETN